MRATPRHTAATIGTKLIVAMMTMATVVEMTMGILRRWLRAGTRGRSRMIISSLLARASMASVEPIIRSVSPACSRRLERRSRWFVPLR